MMSAYQYLSSKVLMSEFQYQTSGELGWHIVGIENLIADNPLQCPKYSFQSHLPLGPIDCRKAISLHSIF